MDTSDFDPFKTAIGVGVALAVVGVGAYVAIEDAHVTTLIPAIFGVIFVFLGRFGLERDDDLQVAYGIGGLAVLGILGSLRVASDLAALVGGDSVDSTAAVASQSLMLALCIVALLPAFIYIQAHRAEA